LHTRQKGAQFLFSRFPFILELGTDSIRTESKLFYTFPRPAKRFIGQEQPAGLFRNSMKTVAIIGASNDRRKFGNKAVRAFQQQGYTVYPVHPYESEVEGLPAYKSIRDVPVRPQMVSVYVPPPVLLKLLSDIAARGCDELWLNPGTESDEALAEAQRLGLNVVQACSIVGVGVSPSHL
jgi:hypothetical protein